MCPATADADRVLGPLLQLSFYDIDPDMYANFTALANTKRLPRQPLASNQVRYKSSLLYS